MKLTGIPFIRAALLTTALALLPALPAHATPPPGNDFFANATDITSSAPGIPGTKAEASAEIGEPLHGGTASISVWYKWVAPSNGAAVFSAAGTGFDPVVAVYSGQTVANLTLVAQSDTDPLSTGPLSRAVFPVVKNQTYRIAVAGEDNDPGAFTLTWSVAPKGLVRFAKRQFAAGEESGTADIAIERVGGPLDPLTVSFTAQDADDLLSATAGLDYVATTVNVDFGAGQTTAVAHVTLLSDTLEEGDEIVQLSLAVSDADAVLGLESRAILTIRDDEDDPANDAFASAEVLSGDSGSVAGDNGGAGPEAGEPAHGGIESGHSIWYKFQAVTSGALLLDTAGSKVYDLTADLDTVVAVYTGDAVNALTLVGSNDNASDDTLTSQLIVPVTAGKAYYIAIDSRGDGGQTLLGYTFAAGGIVQFSKPVFPVDEDRGPATITVKRIGGAGTGVSVTFATADESATANVDYTKVERTLDFGPTEMEKTVTIPILNDAEVEGDETVSLVLSAPTNGAQLGALPTATLLIDDDDDNPANDFFAAAAPISGDAGDVTMTNVDARSEPGEPTHGAPGGRSIWFKWRAPASGVVTFDTVGSANADGDPLDTLLAIYTGSSLNTLTRVAGNDNTATAVTARTSFAVRGGTTYFIAADGRGGVEGDIELSWTFGAGGLISFSQSRYDVNELGSPQAVITLRRTDGLVGSVSVDYTTDDVEAVDGEDYTGGTGTVTFANGQPSATFTIPILDDTKNEGDESLRITLSNPQGGAVVGDGSSAIVVINDNEDDPANDNFGTNTATPMSGNSGSLVSLNSGASREAGEPLHAGVAAHRSVWFKWTPSGAGVASIDTMGSSRGGRPLDTLLAVYTGTSVSALTPIAANNDASPGVKTSRVSFAAKSGTTYFIAVDSADEAGGEIALQWSLGTGGLLQFRQAERIVREDAGSVTLFVDRIGSTAGAVSVNFTTQVLSGAGAASSADFGAVSGTLNFANGQSIAPITVPIVNDLLLEGNERFAVTLSNPLNGASLSSETVSSIVTIDDNEDDPANDTFAAATELKEIAGSVTGTLAGAGVEEGEPATPGGRSVWFRWTAPKSGIVQFDTAGSGAAGAPLDTILTAFTGSALGALQPVATNDDATPGDVTSRIGFPVIVGTTYRLAVDARPPLTGPAKLNWVLSTGGAISFESPSYHVDETQAAVSINITRAGSNVNGASVSYETVDGTGTAAATAPLNYTAKQGTVTFAAGQLSQTISIPIKNTANGEQTFTVRLKNPTLGATIDQGTTEVRIFDTNDNPANDRFSGATVLTGTDDSVASSNVGAGRDADESLPSPLLTASGSGRTVWFKWQAPTSGPVTFTTEGSLGTDGTTPLDTVLAIFSGTPPGALKLVAENDEAPGEGRVSLATFEARAGAIYYVVVDTVGEESGSIALSWSTAVPDGDGPLLLPTPDFTPSVTFKENYSESLKSDGSGGLEIVPTNGFSITINASLAAVDTSSFGATTPFSFSVGGFAPDEVTLGDATSRTATSATFPITIDTENGTKKVGSYKVSWTAKTLKITATTSGTADYMILGNGFVGPVDPSEVNVSIAGVTGHRGLYVTGKTSTRTDRDNDLVTVSIAGTTDYIPPTVTFTSPATVGSEIDTLALNGTATDNFSVTDVQVRVNGGDFIDGIVYAQATTPDGDDPKNATWSITGIPLVPGLNNVEVVATDESGNVSVTSRVITRPKQSAITLVVNGQGTIQTSFPGTVLAVGTTYNVTAVPANDWVFRGWSYGGSTQSAPVLSFVMTDGLVITAKFVPNPFRGLGGTYGGLVRSGTSLREQTGTFSVELTGNGSFSGTFYLGTKRVGLAGTFDDAGNATVSLPPLKTGGPALIAKLSLDLQGGSEQITGSIGDGTFSSSVVADHVVFDAKSNSAPQAGKYTVLLPPAAGLRSPTGYFTVTVNPDGSVRLVGALPDGPAASFGGQLSKSGVVQLYCTLPTSALLVGGAVFSPATADGAQGSVTWIRPGLDNLELGFRGEFYTPPNKTRILPLLTDGKTKVEIGGTGLIPAVVQNITIGLDNKVLVTTPASPGVTKITFTPASGLFSATIKRGTKTFTATGVSLQNSSLGGGFFAPAGGSGYVLIGTP